jgi:protein SCO1/2
MVRLATWIVLGAILLLGLVLSGPPSKPPQFRVLGPGLTLSRPYALMDRSGAPIDARQFIGKPTVWVIAGSPCSTPCTKALTRVSSLLQDLGDDAKRLSVVFVLSAADATRSSGLSGLLAPFDERIVGLAASPEQAAALAEAFNVDDTGAEAADRDAVLRGPAIVLSDKDGHQAALIQPGDTRAEFLANARRLIGMPS